MLVCQGLVVFEEFRRFRICMVQACRRLFSVLYRACRGVTSGCLFEESTNFIRGYKGFPGH